MPGDSGPRGAEGVEEAGVGAEQREGESAGTKRRLHLQGAYEMDRRYRGDTPCDGRIEGHVGGRGTATSFVIRTRRCGTSPRPGRPRPGVRRAYRYAGRRCACGEEPESSHPEQHRGPSFPHRGSVDRLIDVPG